MKIFLDDKRSASGDDWTIARNFNEFKDLINRAVTDGENIEAIAFDHDLGHDSKNEVEFNGYYAVKWLAEYYPELLIGETEITCHSDNSVGRENIEKFVESCRRHKDKLLESKKEEDLWSEMRIPK